MSKANNASDWYATTFKQWPKQVGPKPTAEQLDTIHKLGARPGKQALANALMLRDGGVTGAQIVMACGAPQLNKMRDFVSKGLAKRVPISNDAAGHTVYKLTLTPRGTAKVAKAVAPVEGDAKPAKASKHKAKADKPVDVQPVAMPVNEPVADQPVAVA